jgi:hypothetical protein
MWREATVLRQYKEILYGAVFGLGAAAIDIIMDRRMDGRSFADEVLRPSSQMLLPRFLFLIFGIALGLLLWRSNQREREFRRTVAAIRQFHADIDGPLTLIHAHAQILLTREDVCSVPEIKTAIRSMYEQAQRVQSSAERWKEQFDKPEDRRLQPSRSREREKHAA